ncbi:MULTISPECIES: TatD family hydrolase [Paenibacillus]|uniref:TatD family hydrolase n=1 Tax=Paenibacillus TaxID=44249 RepID=UPI0022B884E9|nr:TatD family hydrolase [Paenibacillus caseinilyticus]MCZ8519842.1 TatD family hydrolase [Paenibacillus caseinilyticus]
MYTDVEPDYPVMDTHIHLDAYREPEREALLASLADSGVQTLVAVSMNLASCGEVLRLARCYPPGRILCAFGYHPEQPLPHAAEEEQLFAWIRAHRSDMAAVGEVGLPYYLRQAAEARGEAWAMDGYIRLLDRFIALAAELDKPIVLHAVYEDADIALDLLERHGVHRAHFHWFKGSGDTLRRMMRLGCYVSVTPDIVYKAKTQAMAAGVTPSRLLTETDGPWPFAGPFEGRMTHPVMIQEAVAKIAEIQGVQEREAGRMLYENACRFYGAPIRG